MKGSTTGLFGVLVLFYGLPVVFPAVSSTALTQAMVVVVGLMVALSDD